RRSRTSLLILSTDARAHQSDICGQLGLQLFDVLEAHGVAQPIDEFQREPRTVQVAGEIDQVRLELSILVGKSRVGPEIDSGGVPGGADLNPPCVDSVAGKHSANSLQVGGREPDRATALGSTDDSS